MTRQELIEKCKEGVIQAIIDDMEYSEIAEKVMESIDKSCIADELNIDTTDIANHINNDTILDKIIDNHIDMDEIAHDVYDGINASNLAVKVANNIGANNLLTEIADAIDTKVIIDKAKKLAEGLCDELAQDVYESIKLDLA